MIDEESLERYGKEAGEFGRHLRNSIDWEKECFYQNNRRCAFLNEESLCDLYKALGPMRSVIPVNPIQDIRKNMKGLENYPYHFLVQKQQKSFCPVKNLFDF